MAAVAALGSQPLYGFGSGKGGSFDTRLGGIRSRGIEEDKRSRIMPAGNRRCASGALIRSDKLGLQISCCSRNFTGVENFHSVDEALMLKAKSEEVLFHLNGRCIYLVGMMGSGKTTVGKILAEVLGYSCFDSDKLAEQAVGMPSVAQIFKVHSEAFFRDIESAVLKDLSTMRRLVVATGGGAVIRPMNWKHMKRGLSIWLDVPLDALAKRIAAVGTSSRPLLDQESGDPYVKAFTKLSTLAEQRGDAYANADARVSLEELAGRHGHGDVTKLTPTDIAVEALLRMEKVLLEKAAFIRSSSPFGSRRDQPAGRA